MVQLSLDEARRPCGRGGWRPGAGRPRGRTCVAHERRMRFAARFPVHVTLRVKDDLPSLRRHGPLRIVQQVIREVGHHPYFRVIHFAARNAIRYVLSNQRAHEARRGKRLNRDWIDPFSSAYWFGGWKGQVRLTDPRQRELLNVPQPTAAPSVWLLTTGWRRWGELGFDELGKPEIESLGNPRRV